MYSWSRDVPIMSLCCLFNDPAGAPVALEFHSSREVRVSLPSSFEFVHNGAEHMQYHVNGVNFHKHVSPSHALNECERCSFQLPRMQIP